MANMENLIILTFVYIIGVTDMKKVCIVTICNGSNFGNRLQNYALQETIRLHIGSDVVTAKNIAGELLGPKNIVYKIMQNNFFEKVIFRLIKHPKIRKKIKFNQFNQRFILWADDVIDGENIPDDFAAKYDYFVTGSDQVWNLEIPFISSFEFLCFAPDSKKIAYAASFGMSEFSSDKQRIINERLQGFKHISVRENSALQILNNAGIKDAKVLVDPTLLLSANQWYEIEKVPEFEVTDKQYILVYILEEDKTEIMTSAEQLARNNKWKIIDIYDKSNYMHYGIGPSEFIYLIHHAAYVFTNSFHATVFSILFHKPISVFKREGLNSRIMTLLEMLEIDNCISSKQMKDVDWNKVDIAVDKKKKEAIYFLKSLIRN